MRIYENKTNINESKLERTRESQTKSEQIRTNQNKLE